MEKITAGSTAADHQQAIRDRLRNIKELFNFSRYRLASGGDKLIDGDTRGGSPEKSGKSVERSGASTGTQGGRTDNIYALFLSDDGQPGEEVSGVDQPKVAWVCVADGTRISGFLEDRAAKFLADQNLLQINADFRGFTDLMDRWSTQYREVPGARREIEEVCREWFEKSLTETVLGVQMLKDSPQWTIDDYTACLSEEALTAAVMPRYHIDVAVKRALGAKLGTLKDR